MAVDPGGEIVQREIEALSAHYKFDVEVRSAFNKNSEDLTPADWGRLIEVVQDMKLQGFDRFVITHGTDTLAYSAAALGLVFHQQGVRICLTGSFHALEVKGSDGPLNLLAAFHTVANDTLPEDVYVAFRKDASNTQALIHHALSIKPMGFDDGAFASVAARHVAEISRAGEMTLSEETPAIAGPAISDAARAPEALMRAADDILCVNHYPGVPWQRLAATGVQLMLIGLYHSGTGHALEAESGSLRAFLQEKPANMQIIGATFPSDEIPIPYESTAKLSASGLDIVKDLPLHLVYVFAVLELASGRSMDDIMHKLAPWLMAPARR